MRGGIYIIFFLFLDENICYGYSLEAPRRGASNEHLLHMFSSRNKKDISIFGWKKRLICCYVVQTFSNPGVGVAAHTGWGTPLSTLGWYAFSIAEKNVRKRKRVKPNMDSYHFRHNQCQQASSRGPYIVMLFFYVALWAFSDLSTDGLFTVADPNSFFSVGNYSVSSRNQIFWDFLKISHFVMKIYIECTH